MTAPLVSARRSQIYLLGLALALGVRTAVQWRRTGDTGLRLAAGPVGSVGWWSKLLFIAALVLGLAGPLAGLAGLEPIGVLDHRAARIAGLVVAGAGLAATLIAQLHMGPSWRIGVDAAERTALVTGGAFAAVRNPIFTAMTATSLGLALIGWIVGPGGKTVLRLSDLASLWQWGANLQQARQVVDAGVRAVEVRGLEEAIFRAEHNPRITRALGG